MGQMAHLWRILSVTSGSKLPRILLRNCLKSLGCTCDVALRATKTVLFRSILASVYCPNPLSERHLYPFQTVSLRLTSVNQLCSRLLARRNPRGSVHHAQTPPRSPLRRLHGSQPWISPCEYLGGADESLRRRGLPLHVEIRIWFLHVSTNANIYPTE
jgi:hypothetical protein